MAIDFPMLTSPADDGYVKWPGGGVRSFVYKSGKWKRNAGTALPRNLFVNPAMQINEQNGLVDATNLNGLVLAENVYMYHALTAAGGTWRGQRIVSPTPGGSKYRLRVSVSVASSATPIASGDWLAFNSQIEASKASDCQWGDGATLNPQYAVVRFGWRSPAGTYAFGVRNHGNTECYAYPFTVTSAQANTDIVQICIIPPNYWETWPTGNVAWLDCYWSVLNGSMLPTGYEWYDGGQVAGPGMTNTFMRTAGNTVELFDIGFYVDPNATGIPPVFQVPHYEDDLQDCQRYWQRMFGARGVVATAGVGYSTGFFQVPMRVSPAASIVGAPRMYDVSVAPAATSISHLWSDGTNYYLGPLTASNNMTVGRPFMLLTDGAQYTSYIALNARM